MQRVTPERQVRRHHHGHSRPKLGTVSGTRNALVRRFMTVSIHAFRMRSRGPLDSCRRQIAGRHFAARFACLSFAVTSSAPLAAPRPAPRCATYVPVAVSVDCAQDSKSCVPLGTCGFESRLGYSSETACFPEETGRFSRRLAFPPWNLAHSHKTGTPVRAPVFADKRGHSRTRTATRRT